MKQTLEQAAEQYGRRINAEHPSNAATHFLAGSAWQKQQGIEWIRCDRELPAPFERTNFGVNSLQVLVTDGLNLSNTYYSYSHDAVGYGWFAIVFTPTHWAIINLPKTNE